MALNDIFDTKEFTAAMAAQIGPGNALHLHDFAEFPLSRNVALPEDMPFDLGHVGMAFHQLALGTDTPVTVRPDGDEIEVEFGRLTLSGVYRLAAKKAMKLDMDTAGTLMDFPEDGPAAGAVDAGLTPLDPEQNAAMLDQARAQRTKLRETPNGQAMVDVFNEHNEAFNTVFVNNSTLRDLWRAGGATQNMAVDTSDAVKNDTVVNSSEAKYNNGVSNVTYNGNAFVQQINVTLGAILEEGDPTDENFEPDPDSPFTKAALAALTFGNAVGATGNDKSEVNELNATGIHTKVQTGTKPPEASSAQLANAIGQGLAQGGGAAAAEARERNWPVLDEEDRAHVRKVLYLMTREKFERENAHPEALWSGACSAILDGVTARLSYDSRGALKADVTLPAFLVDLDDSRWHGETADVIRERLRDMYFVRRMMQEGIRAGLRRLIEESATTALGEDR
ncbi:hypothetical protein [Gymnodinialimonas sp.]